MIENRLTYLLQGLEYIAVQGDINIHISGIAFDSREVKEGFLFVAVKGTLTDGHKYISQAIENGCRAIVCEEMPAKVSSDPVCIKVEDSARFLGLLASAYYRHPSRSLKVVGVTGTNGKTTIAGLLHALTLKLGFEAGLISTVENKINEEVLPATHTTPDPVRINHLMHQMTERGCTFCFMEVSSHAVHQQRIAGLYFAGGIFTNLTHDHLDYHGTFKNYLEAKKKFFDDLPPDAFALVNSDDKNGLVMIQNTRAIKKTYALRKSADYKAKIIESHYEGSLMTINRKEVWIKLPGLFNAYNLLAVYGAANLLALDDDQVLEGLSSLQHVPGRFDIIRASNGTTAVIDYAHTPDALLNVLNTINGLRKGNERIITLVGAGGNRDKAKRPVMARTAVEQSDIVILTSDNPRNEKPDDILNDMLKGVPEGTSVQVISITSRADAIKTACMLAKNNDVILVAGKGHETYQEVEGVRFHFDDKEQILKNFNQ